MSPAARRFGKDGRRKLPRTCFCIGNSLARFLARGVVFAHPCTRCRGSASADAAARCITRIPASGEGTDAKSPRIGAAAAGSPHLCECTFFFVKSALPAPAPCEFYRSAFSGGIRRGIVPPTCGKLAVFVLRGARKASIFAACETVCVPCAAFCRHFADRSARSARLRTRVGTLRRMPAHLHTTRAQL